MPPRTPSSDVTSPPPPPNRGGRGTHRQPSTYNQNQNQNQRSGGRRRGYSYPDNKRNSSGGSSRITIVLCVWHGPEQGFSTAPVTFDRNRSTDEELWTDIRATYRNDLERLWRRLLLFKKLRYITPIEFTRNDVPIRQDPKKVPGEHEFMHAYRHPMRLRTTHQWVDWFVDFRHDAEKTYGLEFVEGLWAEKLAFVAIIFTIAIIVVSVVWCVRGGDLQTVFTVMGFVLTGAAAEIALVALYYQVTLPG